MEIPFWLIQVIGFVAWLILGFSYYRESTNKILVFQVLSTILFCLHYILLHAYSGLIICIFEVVRDSLYYKTDKDNSVFIASSIVYIGTCIISFMTESDLFSYETITDLFPVLASLVDGFFLTKERNKAVFGGIISYTLWFIYDMIVMSYSGAITDAIIVISNIFILVFHIDLFKGKEISKFPKKSNWIISCFFYWKSTKKCKKNWNAIAGVR